jgi:hypothetical protein
MNEGETLFQRTVLPLFMNHPIGEPNKNIPFLQLGVSEERLREEIHFSTHRFRTLS